MRRNSPFLLAAATATTALAGDSCLSLVSWSDPRVDVFGAADDTQIWHKFYTGHDWQPFNGFEYLPWTENHKGCPAVTTWGEGRLDISFAKQDDGSVAHIYYDGSEWGADDLGGKDIEALTSTSWGKNRLDFVGRTENGSYVHKAWTGKGWYPEDDTWEDFGGSFFSDPATVSWGAGRLDIIGLSADGGHLLHKYYQDGWSKWENLGGGPFVGNPLATSWGPGRLDFWAIDSDGQLNHLYWDGSQWKGWEKLGGEFTDTPEVVHWNASKIDIVGKGLDDDKFHLKSYDGSRWNPDKDGWYELAGPFTSEPGLLAKHQNNFLYVFGIDDKDELRMQMWTGYDWQPGFNQTWSMGNTSYDAPENKLLSVGKAQSVLGSLEL